VNFDIDLQSLRAIFVVLDKLKTTGNIHVYLTWFYESNKGQDHIWPWVDLLHWKLKSISSRRVRVDKIRLFAAELLTTEQIFAARF